MRKLIWVTAIVLTGAGIGFGVTFLAGSGDTAEAGAEEASTIEFETVAERDLRELTTLDGTLGFPEGDRVSSRLRGTITDVAEAGTVVDEGEMLFAVDGEPVVFLQGSLPAFRDIGIEPTTITVTAPSSGTITSLPEPGTTLAFNDELVRIDDVPLVVLSGDLPAWRGLTVGSEGIDVLQLESALVDLGYDPGNLAVDEDYTSVTETMVANWQFDVGLESTGTFSTADAVFAPTEPLVVETLVSVGDRVNAGAPLLRIESRPSEIDFPLELDDRGADVRELQERLSELGYDLGVDGSFGEATEEAVLEFQDDQDIDETGVVDEETWDILFAETEFPIEEGASGTAVRQLQDQLVELGYEIEEVDGSFDDETGDAVTDFQDDQDLDETGVVDQETWDALFGSVAEGDAEADVLQLQEALARLGYDTPTDGVMGDATASAIRAWQADVGAEVDGVVDLGEVIFLPDAIRVTDAILDVGSPVNDGSAVLATSASTSVVLVDLPADDQDLLTVGLEVIVEMPNGSDEVATVEEISGIAVRNEAGDTVFETRIALDDAAVGSDLDQAPVDVHVVTDERLGAVAVPVTALLALAEGGYAVEVVRSDGSLGLVGVDPGLFADGWVEVESSGLNTGDRVVVP